VRPYGNKGALALALLLLGMNQQLTEMRCLKPIATAVRISSIALSISYRTRRQVRQRILLPLMSDQTWLSASNAPWI